MEVDSQPCRRESGSEGTKDLPLFTNPTFGIVMRLSWNTRDRGKHRNEQKMTISMGEKKLETGTVVSFCFYCPCNKLP